MSGLEWAMGGVSRVLGTAACLGGLLLAPALASAQDTGRLLLATVVDGRGRALVDFDPDDFVITEGGQLREVLDVHVADYPVIVLVDDAQESPQLAAIRTVVGRFISRIGERPVAVGTLSSATQMVGVFDLDRTELLSRVAKMTLGAEAALPLPAVAHAARLLQETGSPFSAIVIVTGRPIDATEQVEGALLPSILESGATIHVVESRPSQSGANGLVTPEAPDLLRVLAEQTRGQYTTIFSAVSFPVALDRLAVRLSAELMVQYLVPPGGSAGDVSVGVRRIGARVLGWGVK